MAGGNKYTGTYNDLRGYIINTFLGQTASTPSGPVFGHFQEKVPTYRYSGVSEGCFLIDVTTWNSFMNHFPVGMGRTAVINILL